MTVEIHQLIAAINSMVFCEPATRREAKRILKEAFSVGDSHGCLTAAREAIPAEPNRIAIETLEQENPFRLPGFKSPTERHTLVCDSFEESLEAFYFWLLDEFLAEGWAVNKLTDTFSATPGSGLFSEMSRRESRAQQEAMRLLREAHSLTLDILRTAAISQQLSLKEAPTRSSNGSRSEVERSLLRSKVGMLRLYARWLGPYLRQARQLEQKSSGGAALVNLFNTATAEVTLLAQKEYDVKEDVNRETLPGLFLKARRRDYFSVLIIELKLRAAPERTSPGAYGYRGRFELTFTSYALNTDELAVLHRELDRENLDEIIHSLGEASSRVLNELITQIDELVAEPKQPDSTATDLNPFFALLDFSEWFGGGERKIGSQVAIGVPRPDSEIEKVIRSQGLLDARRRCQEFYNRCKQTLRMPILE